MFGAKFQKWIDIVRPNRKKSNKNKNGNGNLVSQSTSNDYKGAVYQNETSISSPARRSEVSPIQNHNGRRGWQSPSQEIPGGSTKIDNYPFLKPSNVIKSSSFKESSLSANNNSKYNSNNNSSNNNSNSIRPPNNYLTTAPTTYYQMKEIDQSMMQSNPQIIVTSKSTTSINNNSIHYNNTLHPPPLCYSTATSSSNELLDEKPKYLISSSSSSVNSAVIKGQSESNNNLFLTTSSARQEHQQQQTTQQQQQKQPNESKYGKIQPINKYMSKYRFFSSKSSTANATSSSPSTIDRYNGNSSDDFCSTTSTIHLDALSLKGGKSNSNKCESSNVANGNSIKRNNEINNMNRNSMGGMTSKTASSSSSSTLQPSSMNGKIYRGNGGFASGSTSSNSAYSLIPPMTQQQLQHGTNKLGYSVINHVSSPESAYSTGYSTDGNSPGGASYSPEYYINIRTGIHYFPKGNTTIDPNNRFKSGLNRIEEKNDEQQFSHKRTESFDCTRSISTMNAPQGQLIDVLKGKSPSATASTGMKGNCNAMPSPGMSPVLRKNILMASPQFRTPSPRQRCRIKTNPWLSSVDPEPFNIPTEFQMPTTTNNVNANGSPNLRQRRDRDSGDSATSSSGIKSNSDESNEKFRGRKGQGILSDPDSDSSTEKPSKTLMSLSDFRRKYKKDVSRVSNNASNQHETDEDATLNEIGKFDESYTFEKDHEFLSDSDKTDCVSDLGQEAGDECDTDDLLDIEYVGKTNGNGHHEATDDEQKKKLHAMMKSGSKKQHQQQQQQQQQDRKKKKVLSKRRSKNSESNPKSPMLSNRGCRSVGGTPVLIRRSGITERRHPFEAPLTNRSSSLTFSEVHFIHSRMMAISESEKALIKADLEADVKYKQLIHEAESILISMKSNIAPTSPVPPKEINLPTVINSPRRVCNVPTNKRVEMLRNCEVDLKRELSKHCGKVPVESPPSNAPSVINKRLEMLRFETSMSAPSSPKNNRVAPIKTHITNFIYQNEIELSPRREISPKSSPKKSPAQLRRRFLQPKQDADTDSDSDNKSTHSRASGKENSIRQVSRVKNGGSVEQVAKSANPPQMISFRSVICNNLMTEDMFLPQSEPLKRKIYSRNNKTIDKIQRSLDFDEEIPKKALLQKIHLMRKERQAKNKAEDDAANDQRLLANSTQLTDTITNDANKPLVDENFKRKLIMQTIEEIKKSLEDQSLELNELHDSDN